MLLDFILFYLFIYFWIEVCSLNFKEFHFQLNFFLSLKNKGFEQTPGNKNLFKLKYASDWKSEKLIFLL